MKVKACISCGYENDATRVFCTNCGTRLTDELTNSKKPAPEVPETRSAPSINTFRQNQSIRPNKQNQPSSLGQVLGQLIFTAAMAAIIAALIQMARTPDSIPPPVKPDSAGAQKTFEALQQCGSSPTSQTWTVNAGAINEFVISTIQMVPATQGSSLQAEFRRAFVRLNDGEADFFIEQRFLTRDLYFRLGIVPESATTGLVARVVGASIGRVPVHPALLPALMPIFKPSLAGLEQATTILQKASEATITPTDVLIKWPGSTSSR